MAHFVLLIACAVVIYLACEWFINAVEWLGLRLRVGPLAVGTILAAFGTALPESVVTFVAVVFGGDARQKDIGVGAAMGGPLALATVAYGVTGWMLLMRLRRTAARAQAPVAAAGLAAARDEAAADVAAAASRAVVAAPTPAVVAAPPLPPVVPAQSSPGTVTASGSPVAVTAPASPGASPVAVPAPASPQAGGELGDLNKLARDQRWFLAIFVVKVSLGLVAFAVKPWLGLLFFAAYAVYFWREIRGGGGGQHADLEPLLLQRRRSQPATWAVVVQTLVALALIFVASQLFVRQLDAIGPMLGLPAVVTALLLSPIATELPEIMNAIIWVRQGKTRLALANISGAMMIQATVPSGLGLLFTPWRFDTALMISGLVTMLAIGYLLILLRTGRFTAKTVSFAAVFYLGFAASLVPILA